jgi:hypothetical protein
VRFKTKNGFFYFEKRLLLIFEHTGIYPSDLEAFGSILNVNFRRKSHFLPKTDALQKSIVGSNQGDLIGRIFAIWAIFNLGQFVVNFGLLLSHKRSMQ